MISGAGCLQNWWNMLHEASNYLSTLDQYVDFSKIFLRRYAEIKDFCRTYGPMIKIKNFSRPSRKPEYNNRPVTQIPQYKKIAPYLIMHHFVTETCTCVHISATKWCIMGYSSNALWYLWGGSISLTLVLIDIYCNNIWGSTYKSNLSKLQVLQNKAVRILTGSNPRRNTDAMFNENGLFNLKDINV